jgi:hypothetical protein
MDLPAPQEVFPTGFHETVAASMAELAVAAVNPSAFDTGIVAKTAKWLSTDAKSEASAISVDTVLFVNSLRTNDPSDRAWASQLRRAFDAVEPMTLAMLLADNCIVTDLVEESTLISGPTLRRLDAVLDIGGVDFCASDIQSTFVGLEEGLAEAKLTWVHQAGAMGLATSAGFTGGLFMMPFIGTMGGKAAEFFLIQGSTIDETSEQAARLLIAALASTSPDGVHSGPAELLWGCLYDYEMEAASRLAHHRSHSANTYTGSGASADQRARMAVSATTYLTGFLKDTFDVRPTVPLPSVEGLPVPIAESILESVGCSHTRQTSDGRSVMMAGNWYVERQKPAQGTTPSSVTLEVAKYSSFF